MQVRFSDEKRFQIHNDGPVKRWMRTSDKLVSGYTRECRQIRVGVMAWLCVASDGSSTLVRCESPQDSASYISTVLTPSLSFIRPCNSGQAVFQQGNASCHVSRRTKAWLAAKRVRVLDPWPALSPDLNVVEHCWAKIAKALVGQSFTSADALWAAVQAAWASVPPTFVRSLYATYVRRLTAVTVAKGGPTRY